MKPSWILACFGMAVFVGGCSSDNNTPDSPTTTADAKPSTVDAATGSDAGSTQKTFTVPLTTAGETPVCASAGAAATGSATIVISADNSTIQATVTYSGLSGTATLAHIHSGTATAAGPAVLSFTSPSPSPITQTFTSTNYSPSGTAPTTFAAFVTAMRAGGAAYVNVHTSACGGGEIRGELVN